MKKLLSLCLVVALLFTFTACVPKVEKPATPSNVKASDTGLITWDAVEGAIGYVVTINNREFSVTTNSYQVSSVTEDFTYSIVAVGKDYAMSDPTETFTFEGKGFTPPGPDLSGVTVGISGGSEVKSGQTLQLTATVNGADNKAVTWSVTSGQDYISVDANGLVTAQEVTGDVVVTVEARSVANSEKFATKTLTVVAMPHLTQAMLDKLNVRKMAFDGFIDIDVYTIGLFPTLETTYSVTIRTMLDGEHWYAEYENSAGGTAALYTANNNGVASSVTLSFNNDEEYVAITDDAGNELAWADSGYVNCLAGLTVEDFTFNEDTWRYEYNGDDALAEKVITSINPYDFVVDGFSLLINGDNIEGIRAVSGDDYTVVTGYRSIQELVVYVSVEDEQTVIEVPTINKYSHEDKHDLLNQAIANMKALDSYTLDFKEIVASVYTSDLTESGFVETVTEDNYHFVPYEVSYLADYTEVHTPKPEEGYGYHKVSDALYNTYHISGGSFLASRAFAGDISAAKPSFDFAAEIFREVYTDEETGETIFYVADEMSGVATTFYNCVGNDLALYGIFATRGYISETSSFTPYVVVKDGYITEACFYFNMGLMYGVVELKYSDFNQTQVPADVNFDGYEVRQIPTSWDQLTLQVSDDFSETGEDVEVNAAEYWKYYFGDENVQVPFFGEALGDTFGFGLTTLYNANDDSNIKRAIVLYYDVPLDIDYTISTSMDAVKKFLVSQGFEKDQYGAYVKGDVHIAPVDKDLDLQIYVWTETPPVIE